MDVHDVMTSPARTMFPDDSLNAAVKMMRDAGVGFVPVVRSDGTLVGVLTDRDVSLAAFEFGEALWKLTVADAMRTPVLACRADDTLATAARIMREHRVRRLPVVGADDKPVGIVSLDDLSHASHKPVLDPTPGLSTDELAAVYDATSGRSKHERDKS